MKSKGRILGVWDLRAAPLSFGGPLFLLEEMLTQAAIHNAESEGLCFLGDTKGSSVSSFMSDVIGAGPISPAAVKNSTLLTTLLSLRGIEKCYGAASASSLRNLMSRNGGDWLAWPPLPSDEKPVIHEYGMSTFIKGFHRQFGSIPFLHSKPETLRRAFRFLKARVLPTAPVVVHLKNNPRETGCSNAAQHEWAAFFDSCLDRHDVKFLLIGNEGIAESISKLSNVVVARNYDLQLPEELALIELSFLFMGMASGPCTFALFGETPYLIYKNPEHHAKEMEKELEGHDHFSFAKPFQKVLRVNESTEQLLSQFLSVYSEPNRTAWKRRLAVAAEQIDEPTNVFFN